jgi:hypothetical protein
MVDILLRVKLNGMSFDDLIDCSLHVPSKSEEKHWWESPEENGARTTDTHTRRYGTYLLRS